MRYEKGSDFVEITDGISSNNGESSIEVWIVESSVKPLPGELSARIQKTDLEGYEQLKVALSNWAKANEYLHAPFTSI